MLRREIRAVLAAIVCLSMVALHAARAQVPVVDPNDTGKTLALTLVNESSGDPLEGVQIKVRYDDAQAERLLSPADGVVNLEFSSKLSRFYLEASIKGFVPMRLMYRNATEIPATYTLALEPASVISGKIVDDAGAPIEGATVVLWITNNPNSQRPNESFNAGNATVKTDAAGKWSFDGAPAKIQRLLLGAYHPKYASGGSYPMNEVTENAGLRDGTYQTTIPRGKAIRGVVQSSDGKPLAGATVGLGADRVASNVLPEIKTDAKGAFELVAKPGEAVVLTIKGKNQSPKLQTFTMPENDYDLVIKLDPPKELAGRVVDANGKPVAGAMVFIDGWQGNRTLSQRMNTDADGRFSWKGAPGDELAVDVLKEGFAEQRRVKMKAGDANLVTLKPPATFHGTVVDVATGEPVKEFKVIRGIHWGEGQGRQISWQRYRTGRGDDGAKVTSDGKFDSVFADSYPGFAVRVEAHGYLPAVSTTYTKDAGDVAFTFKLEKGKSITGTVKDSAGKPVEGADVVLVLAGQNNGIQITNGSLDDRMDDRYIMARTSADGAFTLPPQPEKYAVVVLADAGYAKVSRAALDKSPDITLQAWAVVEGTVKRGSKVASGAMIDGYAQEEGSFDEASPRVFYSFQRAADSDGHFRFDRVPPMKVSFGRRIELGQGMSTQGSSVQVTTTPGATFKIDVGGKGRPITGKMTLPKGIDVNGRWSADFGMSELPKYPFPPAWATMSNDDRTKWVDEYRRSIAGKAMEMLGMSNRTWSRHVPVVVAPDGTYRADDVEPGYYQISIGYVKPSGEDRFGGTPLAQALAYVTVDPFDPKQIDEPVVIAPIEAKPVSPAPQPSH